MAIHIETAKPDEKETIVALLEQGDLLTEDLPAGLPHFVIAKYEETPVGVAGLESFGSVGLLRSVAVDPAHQGKGIAAQLIDRLLATADASHLAELYLITNTADGYFTRYGFAPVSREAVPQAIQQTQQFSGLCPSSAIVMKRTL
ncbi:arsenic resistance N-acetyltransferase ArsN2 [Spirosoma radiotolerans]|uniref:Amino acid acetyltransferase n=1 Tax=Spirosoma radiotolerans TaxID=1379870 RepID=A0A0E3ZTG3_9BACT|nr:arsenic resistance N-acetyltransferase ArsN2 [Spirosoma radiotolerans]AKD53863.1 amino acid acetyltransferase [Spirosoma radiotolerans]